MFYGAMSKALCCLPAPCQRAEDALAATVRGEGWAGGYSGRRKPSALPSVPSTVGWDSGALGPPEHPGLQIMSWSAEVLVIARGEKYAPLEALHLTLGQACWRDLLSSMEDA